MEKDIKVISVNKSHIAHRVISSNTKFAFTINPTLNSKKIIKKKKYNHSLTQINQPNSLNLIYNKKKKKKKKKSNFLIVKLRVKGRRTLGKKEKKKKKKKKRKNRYLTKKQCEM